MLSTCPSVRPSVCYRSAEHDIVKTKEPIVLQIGTSGPRGRRGWNGQLLGSGGQSSRSNDPEIRSGDLAETSFISRPFRWIWFSIFLDPKSPKHFRGV